MIEELYNDYCKYSDFYDIFNKYRNYNRELRFILEIAKNKKYLLDLGCGTGTHLSMLENLGYKVAPRFDEKRADIVQTIEFGDAEKLIKFCQGIQKGSAIDSSALPEPWDMPGYNDKIIMASGSFTQGSSIELSCDGPIRPPFIAFLQGGLTYEYGKLGVIKAAENILK